MEVKKKIKDLCRPTYQQIMKPKIKKMCFNEFNVKKLKLLKKPENFRCFIIGNGPSLSTTDLDKLKNEVTFAANRIYTLYDKTQWRPTYYCAQDPTVIRNNIEFMKEDKQSIKLINPIGFKKYFVEDGIYFYVNRDLYNKGEEPEFYDDITQGTCDGFTITYSMIQLAVQMGFKEIYLLGVDFSYSFVNGSVSLESYADKRMHTGKSMGANPNIEYNLKAYEIANKYSNNNNIKIYNATRGGKLEVFERADFDKLFL